MGELYDKTIQREEKIRDRGYQVIAIWEEKWDFLKARGFDEEITEEKMREFLGKKYITALY